MKPKSKSSKTAGSATTSKSSAMAAGGRDAAQAQ